MPLICAYTPSTMNRFLCSAAFTIALLAPLAAVASQEGALQLREFRLTSPGIDQSGAVVVSGKQSANQFVSLTVQAFGRTVSLSKHQLAKLRGGLVNGLQISYEAGYRELGGRTVYIVLSKGVTSGLRETQFVSINEQGTVKVHDPK